MNKRRWPILVLWILITLTFSLAFAPSFFSATKDEFEPPADSDAAIAFRLYEEYFPENLGEFSHLVIAHEEAGDVLGTELQAFTFALNSSIQQHFGDKFTGFLGYYVFAGTPFDEFKSNFISEDNTTSMIILQLDGDLSFHQEVVEHLKVFRDEYESDHTLDHDYFFTGGAELQVDTSDSVEEDLKRIDSITIPIVFIALVIILRNWKYFPVTLLPIGMTIGITFGLLERYIFFFDIIIQSFVPSALVSLSLGIGVDYNLFLLTRFREERVNGRSVQESVEIMMQHAGHTVFTSGLTLSIALAGLAFFPVTILSSIGVGITVAVLVLLATNLTFTPVLLLIIGRWIEPDRNGMELTEEEIQKKTTSGFFYKVGKFATRYNYLILVLILLFTLPIAFQILQARAESETLFLAPRGSDSSEGFLLLQEKFGAGVMGPMSLLLVPENGSIYDETVFDLVIQLIRDLNATHDDLNLISFNSIATLGGQLLPYTLVQAWLEPSNQINIDPTTNNTVGYNSSNGAAYRSNVEDYINDAETALLIEILLPFDPWSPEAKALLETMQETIEDDIPSWIEYGFVGTTVDNASILDDTYRLFPIMILIVIAAIYLLVGIMFRAFILPARLIATVGLTVAFIYGAATVVFEYTTVLNDWIPLLNNVHVIFWMTPIFSFPVIIGLGIDYDIFTIERIRENVWKGMENNEAIAQGISRTASVITGAGIIMMIAFGGLMFSSSYILMQFGFILTFAVFLDTFFVRTLLVPAIMSFAERLNWWPNQPPQYRE